MSIGKAFLATVGLPRNVVFDLDGVLFLGATTINGATEALDTIAATGCRVVFATNNATKTIEAITARIATEIGFTPHRGSVVTSASATAALLGRTDDPVLVVGETGLDATLQEAGRTLTSDPTGARTVVVGLDRAIDYDTMDRASAAVRAGARFIATNTDATFPTPAGAAPGAGAIVAAIATAGGRAPQVVGKPHPPFVRHLRHALAPGPTWIVGDRPETDLATGRAAGWFTVLALSGVTASPADVPRHLAPDLVIASVADLTEIFAQ